MDKGGTQTNRPKDKGINDDAQSLNNKIGQSSHKMYSNNIVIFKSLWQFSFSSYVRIRDVVLKTYLGRWTIGRSDERGSGISVLPARDDDDDDDDNFKCLYKKVWKFVECTTFKMDKGGTQTNGPKEKGINDEAQSLTLDRWHRQIQCVKKKRRWFTGILDCVNVTI